RDHLPVRADGRRQRCLQQRPYPHRCGRHLPDPESVRVPAGAGSDRPGPEPAQRGLRRRAGLPGARHPGVRRIAGVVLEEGKRRALMATIEGVDVEVTAEAVVVTAAAPLTVLSSAVAGGGLGRARAIVNLHVDKNCPWEGAEVRLDAFAARRGLPAPWVGLLTAAWTEHACVVIEHAQDVGALVVVTVGLSNPIAAGWSAAAGVLP